MKRQSVKYLLAASLVGLGSGVAKVRGGAVVTDGTVGAARSLQGPLFSVTADLGRQVGPNLFQSFSTFTLSPGEVASFSGPGAGKPVVTNILARVTGGHLSIINGTIQSTVPGANFYFINPAGVVFGADAQLDVSGSFIVSTGDVVKLADGGKFNASHPLDDLLTSAAPAAFGFLSKPPAPNGANPQGEIDVVGQSASQGGIPSVLTVPNGKSISIIGGNIILLNGIVSAPSGNINIASVSGSGDVKVNPADATAAPDTSAVSSLGLVGLRTGVLIADGAPGGRIAVRAGQMFMDTNSTIASDTSGGGIGGGLDFLVSGKLTVFPGSEIVSSTSGPTQGGSLLINAGAITLDNSSVSSASPTIQATTAGTGRAGDLIINTNNLTLVGPGFITDSTSSSGDGGNLQIDAPQITASGGACIHRRSIGRCVQRRKDRGCINRYSATFADR